MLKTLGGERLGSGQKMRVAMHNYERSTHDLSQITRTTMAPGVLTPVLKLPVMNGDTFTIDTQQLIRTMPAIGPLMGSFKFQCDIFEVPVRLYQGLLHNNATRIGMNMNKVKLPVATYRDKMINLLKAPTATNAFNQSSLLAFMGMRGIGGVKDQAEEYANISRTLQCVPILGYYDIFKNYYANKQEEKAYVIDNTITETPTNCTGAKFLKRGNNREDSYMAVMDIINDNNNEEVYYAKVVNMEDSAIYMFTGKRMEFYFDGGFIYDLGTAPTLETIDAATGQMANYDLDEDNPYFKVEIGKHSIVLTQKVELENQFFHRLGYNPIMSYKYETQLKPFKLENIDQMRTDLLRATEIGTTFDITTNLYSPYREAVGRQNETYKNKAHGPLQGLVVKTYQSDYFNNWLSAEWIDGLEGINAITAVSTESGKFTIDALNLAHKVYNMLNRIAVSGGTYEDWQEAVWGEDAIRRAETPVYLGGCSSTIAFEEVVSTADTLTETAGDQPLGSLAGKGIVVNHKGGNIDVHIKEPGYIIAIASITPLIDYCQGNDFDITEIESLDDFHKPELDQIGFENLLLERAAFWGTQFNEETGEWEKIGTGKLPAWIDYMTNVNKVYGDFADELNFMVLTRNYEHGLKLFDGSEQIIPVRDFTTYIDPSKFNYAFADTSLTAQNFWVQIGFHIESRRKMSAAVIPNL